MTDTENIMQKIWTALDWIPVTEHDEKPWKPVRAAVERVVQKSNDRLASLELYGSLAEQNLKRAERAEAENFTLAAGQCIVDNGLLGDEYGNQYCAVSKRFAAAEAERDALKGLLSTAGSWILALKPYASYESKETIEKFLARIDAFLKEQK